MSCYLDTVNKVNIRKIEEISEEIWQKNTHLTQKERIAHLLEYEYGSKVLDIGPGIGLVATYICKIKKNIKSYVGIEKIERLKKLCEKLVSSNNVDNIEFLQADGCNMTDIKDNTFDTILMAEILEHLYNPLDMLNEAYRVLSYGGNIIITVPSKGLMPPEKVPGHVQDFSVEDMTKLISKSGFKLLHHMQNISWEYYLALKV